MNLGVPAAHAASRRPGRTNETRRRLFEASMTLIGERGPGEVTVDEIAAAAGVSKGTVYYNFGSKSDLIAQLLEYGVQLLEERLVPDPRVDPVQGMKSLLRSTLEYFDEYPSFTQLLISELWRSPSQWHETLKLLRERLFTVTGNALRPLITKKVDETVEFDAVVGLVMGAALAVSLDRQVFHPERSQEQSVAALMLPIRGYLKESV